MSSSAITTQVAQLKIGSIQNQADSSGVYSAGVWSFKNSTALTSVTITDAGNVGIGTASPSSVLDIVATSQIKQQYTGAPAKFSIGQYEVGGAASINNGANAPILFATNNAERMRIGADGSFQHVLSSQLGAGVNPFLFKNAGYSGNGRNAITFDAGNTGSNSTILQFKKNNADLWNIFNDISANNGTDFAIWSSSSGGVTLNSNTATGWSPRSSDERKKKNFETTQGLSEVLQIEPVKYHFNSEEDSTAKRLGFKAQNLQAVIPEMVHPTGEKAEDGSDYLTITPDYILPVLVKAIQELSAKNEALEARLAALESK